MEGKVDVIILAAGSIGNGKGYPKALIEIKGKTLLEKQIKWLKPHVKKIIVACTDSEAKQIKKRHPKINVVFATTPKLPGTAGSLKHASSFTETDNFLVINVDDLTDIDVRTLINFGTDTICVANPRLPYAEIEMDGYDITSFREKPLLEDIWVSCGVYFLSKKLIKKLSSKGNIAKDFFPHMKLKSYKHLGTWHTVEDKYVRAIR